MKLRLNKSLRKALMMSMVAVLSISGNAWSDVYVCVEDVDYENVTASTRFYDQGKRLIHVELF